MVRCFIEKYVSPRHIEIQIMADSHGNILYSKENAAYNVAIKSHRRSSFPVLTPELRKKWVRLPY
jgi:propionyl-CoA carboxylase alpha chain